MKIFSPRITPTQNITFIAIMAGFDAILCLIGALLPFSALLLMILVALISSSTAIFCKARYIAVYIFGAIGVSLAVCAFSLATTIFYLIPSLLSGVAYGYMWKLKLPSAINIIVVALINFALFYAIIYLMRLLFDGIDLIDFLLRIIGRGGDEKARLIFPLFALLYGLAQIVITHIFSIFELSRLGIKEAEPINNSWLYPVIGIVFFGSSIGIAFAHLPTAYVLFGIGIYWAVQSYMLLYPKISPLTVVELVISVGVGIFTFAILNGKFPEMSSLILLSIPLAISEIGVILNPLFCRILPFKPKKD